MKKIFIKKLLIEATVKSRSTEYLFRKISGKFPRKSCELGFLCELHVKNLQLSPKSTPAYMVFLRNDSAMLNPFLPNVPFCFPFKKIRKSLVFRGSK